MLFNRNSMLVLSYISKASILDKDCIASKISSKLNLSVGSVFSILKKFEEMGIIKGTRFGRTVVYEPIIDNPLIKSFRVFDNVSSLNELVIRLKPHCRKILLFGSCSTGDDTFSSDIDLFVVADEDEQVSARRIISDYSIDREIKPIIVDSTEFVGMREKDKVFYSEVTKGIELWGGNNELN